MMKLEEHQDRMMIEANRTRRVRYAYLKTNHAVDEFRRARARPDSIPDGGPDAYVAHFVRLIGDSPALLLSIHFHPEEDAVLRDGNIDVYSYYWFSRWLKSLGGLATRPLGTFVRRMVVSAKILFLLVRFRPDRIICWAHSFPLWAAYLASRICRSSFVYSLHNRVLWNKQRWYQRITDAIDRWVMRHAGAIVVHGPYLKEQVIQIGVDPRRVFEFNWGYSHLAVAATAGKEGINLGLNGTQKVILFVGRIELSKGVFDLFDACSGWLATDPDVRLVYAGEGNLMPLLRERITMMNLQDKIIILGRVPHEKLASLIRQCRIVVTPTQSWFPEGRCMAAIEGLVMGVPVIAPDWGPFPFVVTHGKNGLLYERDSVSDLGRKINTALNDEKLYRRLQAGAKESGEKLLNPATTFLQAVEEAFELATRVKRNQHKPERNS